MIRSTGIDCFRDKKAYNRVLIIVFLIIVLSALMMYRYGATRQESASAGGITGYAVAVDAQPSYKPIQQVSKDLEDMGAQRVANDPGLRYAR